MNLDIKTKSVDLKNKVVESLSAADLAVQERLVPVSKSLNAHPNYAVLGVLLVIALLIFVAALV